MNKILVPTDLSKVSNKALNMAVSIAEKTKGTIHLVNFYKHPYGKTFTATGEMELKASDEENLFTVQLLRKHYKQMGELADKHTSQEVDVTYGIEDEDFEDGVLKYIKSNDINLVVLGTTGEENVKEFFTGNHAQQIVESAPCPVITVREKDINGNLSKIVLGVDFEKDHKDNYLKAVGYLNDLAANIGAEVHVLHVGETNGGEEKLESFAKSYGLLNYKVATIKNTDEKKGLLEYGHKINAAMVAVLTHADGGLFRMFQSSTSEEMTKESDIPVLTINLHKV